MTTDHQDPDAHHRAPRTWHDAYIQTQEFQSLLHKYDNDFQQAVDAWLRGETASADEGGGSANPM